MSRCLIRPALTGAALLGWLSAGPLAAADQPLLHTFAKQRLSDKFHGESANFADFDGDGRMDIVSGAYWYRGPAFTEAKAFRPAKDFDPLNYSDAFFTFTSDIDGDGATDILVVGMPGEPANWYRNPGKGTGDWTRHQVFDHVDNESPEFIDCTGDGRPELVCTTGGRVGYASPDPADATKPWVFHAISDKGGWHKYSHGLGIGDVNGDGRKDFMLKEGWWEQPASLAGDPLWKHHAVDFGGGGAQMHAVDINGDGRNDVVTSLAAHGYGLAWYEQGADGAFTQRLVMGEKPEQNAYGVVFSQLHALVVADIDGDRLPDLVTGKRFWAHGPKGDPEPNAPAVLYWFRQVREQGAVRFVPQRIDDDSGVGTHLVVGEVSGDKLPDVIVGNKKGTFVFTHQAKAVSQAEYDAAQPKPAH